jgi:AcrR family transcriptional regulator
MGKTTKRAPRVRRTAEDARTAILDATERRLVASGQGGIRLQDVAADVGISHPTVLHHFGSRERLVDEVVKRSVAALNQAVIEALAEADASAEATEALFERLFATLGPGGHARVATFVALEGRAPGAEPSSLRPLAEAVHAARLAGCVDRAQVPSFDDSYFTVLLAAFGLFGEALLGPLFRGEPEDAPDHAISKRFRGWLARSIAEHLKQDVVSPAETRKAPSPRGPRPRRS